MSLDSNVQSAILENKRKRDAEQMVITTNAPSPNVGVGSEGSSQNIDPSSSQAQSSGAVVTQLDAGSQSQQAVPQTTDNKATNTEPQKVDEPPVVKKDESTKPADAESVDPDFTWDASIVDEPSQTSSEKVDFKKIGSALNLEVNSESEFVTTVNERFAKLKEYEESSQNISSLPESLKQAIEIAKKGGDWMSYTNTVAFDPTKIDEIDLFEQHFERQELHRYKNADGSIDFQKLDEALDAIPESIKVMQGGMLKQQLVTQQQQRQNQIIAQAKYQQEVFQKSLGEAAQDLSKIISKDTFGIAIEPKHSSYFYEGIAKGTLIKKHFGDIDPAVLSRSDPKKLIRTIVLAELGENISRFQFKQGEVAGKKSLLQSTQNVQLAPVSSPPTPEPATQPVEKKSHERVKEYLDRQKPQNSL